jgi:hypothetical protein
MKNNFILFFFLILFVGCSDDDNLAPIVEPIEPSVIEISFTPTSEEATFKITLSVESGLIDWGNGDITEIKSSSQKTDYLHIYPKGTGSTYKIRVTGLVLKTVALVNQNIKNFRAYNCYSLEELTLSKIQGVESLDLEQCPILKRLNILDCTNLKSLNISNSEELNTLELQKTAVDTLYLDQNNELIYLNCSMNKLRSLIIRNKLQLINITCFGNGLNKLEIQNAPLLTTVEASNNSLTQTVIADAPALRYLLLLNNSLRSISLQNIQELQELDVVSNEFKSEGLNDLFRQLPSKDIIGHVLIDDNQESRNSDKSIAENKGWSVTMSTLQ